MNTAEHAIANAKLIPLLQEHLVLANTYPPEKEGGPPRKTWIYKEGYNDRVLAEMTGLSTRFVVSVREALHGALSRGSGKETVKLREHVDLLAEQVDALVKRIETLEERVAQKLPFRTTY